MAKKSRFDALRKKQAQIDSYYEKILELQEQQKALENEFALKVGQLVLKRLNNDLEDVETFSEWLELYLLEQEERASKDDLEASNEVSHSVESENDSSN